MGLNGHIDGCPRATNPNAPPTFGCMGCIHLSIPPFSGGCVIEGDRIVCYSGDTERERMESGRVS